MSKHDEPCNCDQSLRLQQRLDWYERQRRNITSEAMLAMPHKVIGRIFAITFEPRAMDPDDKHVELNIWIADDETWHHKLSLSSHWSDDIAIVTATMLEQLEKLGTPDVVNGRQYGRRFK